MTGAGREAIPRDQTRCRLSPRIGAGNAGIARAHAPIGGCELELVGADELQLLSRSSTLPNWGRGRPLFLPQG